MVTTDTQPDRPQQLPESQLSSVVDLAWSLANDFLVACDGRLLAVWHVGTRRLVRCSPLLEPAVEPIGACCFHPDNFNLLVAVTRSGSTAMTFNLSTNKLMSRCSTTQALPRLGFRSAHAPSPPSTCLAFDRAWCRLAWTVKPANGCLVGLACSDSSGRLQRRQLCRLALDASRHPVHAMDVKPGWPDNSLLILLAAVPGILILLTYSQRQARLGPVLTRQFDWPDPRAGCCCFLPLVKRRTGAGRCFLASIGGSLVAVDGAQVHPGGLDLELTTERGKTPVTALGVSCDESLAVSGDRNGDVVIWQRE